MDETAKKRAEMVAGLERGVLDLLRSTSSPEEAARYIATMIVTLLDDAHAHMARAMATRRGDGARVRRVVRRSR